MPHYRYLIVGGGMAADAAVRGIRAVDSHGPIGLIGAEPDPPYERPPLSKGLWRGMELERIWRGTAELGVELHLERAAVALAPGARRVVDDGGTAYTYDRLLIATGGSPRTLPGAADGVIYFRTLQDYRRLRELADSGRRFAVIGGGFIGSEIAAALATSGREVIMLFPEDGIGARIFPPGLARFLNDYYREHGVEVRTGALVSGVRAKDSGFVVLTQGGEEMAVDGVVAGLGIRRNTELARGAGLEVDDQGIVVDEFLRTSDPHIFAAGDVASFPSRALGRRVCVEHEDNANTMGMRAGQAMAGELAPYDHLPFFYSDLFDLGYEAVGETDPRLQVVEDWEEPYRKGVLYYLAGGRVRGVLLWNVWRRLKAARQLVAGAESVRPEELKGRIDM